MSESAVAVGTMRSRILRGLGWKVASVAFMQSSRIVVAIVLARLLAPHDFGIAAMVLVFSSLVLIFSDLALGAALVQRRELTERDRSTVFWTSVATGGAFCLAGVALSGPIAGFYGEPSVQPLFAALSVSFLITALGTTQSALLSREMDFRSLELRVMAGILAGAALGIALAVAGYGPWAIIAQQLAASSVSTVLLWTFSSWRPRFTYSLASLRSLAGFSSNVFGTRLIFYVSRNADNLLIGRFLGAASLGAYALAYNVMLLPFERVAGPIQDVLFPAFSRMQDDRRRIGALWLRVNRVVAAITLPVSLGLVVAAPELVATVLGERWRAAVPVMQILACVGFLQSLVRLNSSILQACDRTSLLLRWSLLITSANLIAFGIGLQWGIVGVAAGYAISNALLQPVNTWLTGRAVGVSLGRFAANISGVAQAGAAMVACLLPLRLLLVEQGVPPAARLAALIAAGAAVYLPVLAWRAPEVLEEVLDVRRRRREARLAQA